MTSVEPSQQTNHKKIESIKNRMQRLEAGHIGYEHVINTSVLAYDSMLVPYFAVNICLRSHSSGKSGYLDAAKISVEATSVTSSGHSLL